MKHPLVNRSRGFTLVELMVVVVIATILISIAVPSYMTQVRQSRRVEAKTALLDFAGREERYFSTSTTGANYSAAPADLGVAGAFPVTVGSGYYTVAVVVCGTGAGCGPNAIPGPSYYLTATPVATSSQSGDGQCTSFAVDSVGAQFATGTGGATPTLTAQYCWAN
jgi:type IV pilus assembly protein PilE